MDSEKYRLETPFVSDDPFFALGFEAGMIYERLKRNEPFVQLFHSKNMKQIQIICEQSTRSYHIKYGDENWSTLWVDLRLLSN